MSARVFHRPEQAHYSPPTTGYALEREGKHQTPIEPILGVAFHGVLSQELRWIEPHFVPDEQTSDPAVTQLHSNTPQSFEAAFRRFEPMFHTVFYRKYHPDILADAKQVALLALYKKWCQDKTLLEQSASFVTTAAIWGISNWRKKEMKRIPYEKPLLVDGHGHVIGESKTRNPRAWSDALDFQLDLDQAVDTVLLKFLDHTDYKHLYAILRDLVADVPFIESWSSTSLPRGKFKQYRDMLKAELAGQLADYRTRDD